jgi:hypothetical protein
MLAELFDLQETSGQAWLFGATVAATLGFLVMEAGQRFVRRREIRHARPIASVNREP